MASSTKDQTEGTFRKLKSSFREIFGKSESPKMDAVSNSKTANDNSSEKSGPA